jgi:hypothetical protein
MSGGYVKQFNLNEMKNMKPDEATMTKEHLKLNSDKSIEVPMQSDQRSTDRPVNQMTHELSHHEKTINAAIEALKASDHHIVFCMKDLNESKAKGTLSIGGNLPLVLSSLLDALDDNDCEEICMIFKLMQLRQMMREVR